MLNRITFETIARAIAALIVMALGTGLILLAGLFLISLPYMAETVVFGWGVIIAYMGFVGFPFCSGAFLIYLGVNHFR